MIKLIVPEEPQASRTVQGELLEKEIHFRHPKHSTLDMVIAALQCCARLKICHRMLKNGLWHVVSVTCFVASAYRLQAWVASGQ